MKKYLLALFIIPVLFLAFSSSISAQSATVTVDSPTGSSQWPAGSPQTVRWTAVGVFDYYQTIIQIRDASDSISFNLAISAVGEDWLGQRTVTIPAALQAESYKIIVGITYNNTNSVATGVSDLFQVTAAPTSDKFVIGDRVVTNAVVNVRDSANGTVIDTKQSDAHGTVIGGPTDAGGFTWWQIDYDCGDTGWSADNFLDKYTGSVVDDCGDDDPGPGDDDFGWQEPALPPPECETDPTSPNYRIGCLPPINVSIATQEKAGGLRVHGFRSFLKAIFDEEICLGGICRTTWPTGGPGGGDNLGVTGAPGSHVATQSLILGSWPMSGSGGGQPSFLLNELSSTDGGLQVVNMKDSGYPSLLVDNPRIGGPVDREVFTVRGSGGAAAFNVKRNAVCIFGDCRDTWPTPSGDPSPSVWQKRVINSCAEGYSIREISETGVVTCEFDDGGVEGAGDITAVNTPTGSGLSGGATSGAVNLSLKTCAAGQVLKWIDSATKWDCGADNTGGGGLRTDCATGEILQWFGSPTNQWRCAINLYTTANTNGGLDIILNPSIPSNLLASIKDDGVTTAKIKDREVKNADLGLIAARTAACISPTGFDQYTSCEIPGANTFCALAQVKGDGGDCELSISGTTWTLRAGAGVTGQTTCRAMCIPI